MADLDPVAKLSQILAADPRSRVFVDLARALVGRGELQKAIDVCWGGLVHHPDSIQGRVVLGGALLQQGRPEDALEPLERAAELAPADARVRELLAEARREATPGQVMAHAAPAPPAPVFPPRPEDVETLARGKPPPPRLEREPAAAGQASPQEPPATSLADIEHFLAEATVRDPDREQTGSVPLSLSPPVPVLGERRLPPPGKPGEPPPASPPAREPPVRSPQPPPRYQEPPARPPPAPRAAPPEAPPLPGRGPAAKAPPPEAPTPEPKRKRGAPEEKTGSTALHHLPDDPEAAARIAAKYEAELRDKMLKGEKGEVRRGPAIATVVAVLLVLASLATYAVVRHLRRADEARSAVAAARAGLARDTLGSLREAARALEEARRLDPSLPDAASLLAQVDALLWADFADEKALDRARELAKAADAGEGAIAARYLTAADPAQREEAAAALVRAAPSGGPLVRLLAGDILRGRGDRDAARQNLEAAARATPPMLRALVELGDMARAAGEPEQALRLYRTALQGHATHPRAALGAAEARLALGKGLEEGLRDVEAMDADPQSAPPGPERLRAELVHARLLFVLGRQGEAVEDLRKAAGRFPGRAEVPAAMAEVNMARGEYDAAVGDAERAARLAPADAAMAELLARARLGRGRFRELLRDTEGTSSRALRLLRAQARAELGEWALARAELEQTRRDGRMSAEAAAWAALCEAAAGRRTQAGAILQALVGAGAQQPAARLAQARLFLNDGRRAEAERELRAAAALDGAPPLVGVELSNLLRAKGRAGEAGDVAAAAVRRNPFHAATRLALARARLDLGSAADAAEEADRVLEDRPRDPEALRLVAAARLQTGQVATARAAASRLVGVAPDDAGAWLLEGRAAAAQGDVKGARRSLARALHLAGSGPRAEEARRALAKLPR
ncbi:MAG TPA: tetratricopeptide repeat protein [Anaeromyxobacteraceae bacterium]